MTENQKTYQIIAWRLMGSIVKDIADIRISLMAFKPRYYSIFMEWRRYGDDNGIIGPVTKHAIRKFGNTFKGYLNALQKIEEEL